MNTNTNRNKHNKTDTIASIRTDKTSLTNWPSWLLAFNSFILKKLYPASRWWTKDTHIPLSFTYTYFTNSSKEMQDLVNPLSRNPYRMVKHTQAILRVHSLVVTDLRSETKGSRFKSSCYLRAEVSSLQ